MSWSYQEGWRWCHKCEGLFFAGHPSQGRCPAGGSHDASQSGRWTTRSTGMETCEIGAALPWQGGPEGQPTFEFTTIQAGPIGLEKSSRMELDSDSPAGFAIAASPNPR